MTPRIVFVKLLALFFFAVILAILCRPARAPWVYAAAHRPTSPRDRVYKAPLANVYDNGNTCPGNHHYPNNIAEIPDSFFKSFFTAGADIHGRSNKYPHNICLLWKALDKKKEFPMEDLVYHGTVADLMQERL